MYDRLSLRDDAISEQLANNFNAISYGFACLAKNCANELDMMGPFLSNHMHKLKKSKTQEFKNTY